MNTPERDSKAILSGPLGAITRDLAKVSEADELGIFATILAGFSAYLGPTTRVKTTAGSMPLSLWTILIGTSGRGRKGQATGIGLKVIERAWKSWAEDNVVHSLPGTGLGLVTELSEHTDDDGNTAPTLFIEEEFDVTISAMKKDVRIGTYLRKSFDGADLRHKTSVSNIRVRNPHFGLVANAQPKNYRAILGGKDSTGGSFNRMLPILVTRGRKLPVFGGPNPEPVIEKASKALRRIASDARDIGEVTVSASTARAFERKHRVALEALTDGNDELAEQCERALAHCVRIAALYALAEGLDKIQAKHFDAALALVAYSIGTVRAIMPETVGDSLPNRIAEAVRAAGDEGMTRSELYDAIGRSVKAEEIKKALLTLPQVQETKRASNGGRPSVILRWIEPQPSKKMVAA